MCNNYMYRYYINEAYTFISTFNLRHAIILYLTGMGAVDYGGCDYGECDYGRFYGECEYGGCVSVREYYGLLVRVWVRG